MAFDKDYPNRKDHRKPYYKKGPRNARSHRNHGSCAYCLGNRQHSTHQRLAAAADNTTMEDTD